MRLLTAPMVAAAAVMILLPACATPDGPAITISQRTNAHFQEYMSRMHGIEHGAFAVSPDGEHSFYTYCYQGNCESAQLNFEALNGCRNLAKTDCVILAHNQSILHKYVMADTQGASAGDSGGFFAGAEIAPLTIAGTTLNSGS
ncbi:MAG TPA: hypothetical protein VF920_15590 [Dongiaceae bacterium]